MTDPRIAWALAEMERRVGDDVSLDELARVVNLSRSRFAHLFRLETGVAPGRHLRDLRLQHARRLLETTLASVRDVMTAAGFRDPSHFSRDFAARFGVSPRQWRKQLARPPSPAPEWVLHE